VMHGVQVERHTELAVALGPIPERIIAIGPRADILVMGDLLSGSGGPLIVCTLQVGGGSGMTSDVLSCYYCCRSSRFCLIGSWGVIGGSGRRLSRRHE